MRYELRTSLPQVKEILVKASLCVKLQKPTRNPLRSRPGSPNRPRGQASRPHCRFLSLGWSDLERERKNL